MAQLHEPSIVGTEKYERNAEAYDRINYQYANLVGIVSSDYDELIKSSLSELSERLNRLAVTTRDDEEYDFFREQDLDQYAETSDPVFNQVFGMYIDQLDGAETITLSGFHVNVPTHLAGNRQVLDFLYRGDTSPRTFMGVANELVGHDNDFMTYIYWGSYPTAIQEDLLEKYDNQFNVKELDDLDETIEQDIIADIQKLVSEHGSIYNDLRSEFYHIIDELEDTPPFDEDYPAFLEKNAEMFHESY